MRDRGPATRTLNLLELTLWYNTSMQQGVGIRPIKFLFSQLFLDVVRFPMWWYTSGLLWVLRSIAVSLEDLIQALSLRILLKNLLTPMYGDYTKSGRIISFGVRLVQLSLYGVVTFLWIVLLGVGLFLWIFAPLLVAYSIYYQVGSPSEHWLMTLWNALNLP